MDYRVFLFAAQGREDGAAMADLGAACVGRVDPADFAGEKGRGDADGGGRRRWGRGRRSRGVRRWVVGGVAGIGEEVLSGGAGIRREEQNAETDLDQGAGRQGRGLDQGEGDGSA